MTELLRGDANPLGATVRSGGVNFALFSAHAQQVELCLFDEAGREKQRLVLPGQSGDVFHGFLEGGAEGQRYGYRVHGEWQPIVGDRFNPHKLLIDPYARALDGKLVWHDALFGYQRGHPDSDLSFDDRDSAPYIPKCVVRKPTSRRRVPDRPQVDSAKRIIYEGHVKGLTRQLKAVDRKRRGSYAALASSSFLSHLRSIGVTTLELLPIHGFPDDEFLVERGLVNYWGYQSLSFMAPEARYAVTGNPVHEFAQAVSKIHRKGFEVFLDVVYNHTCEGNEKGPHLSFRGIDNRSYYRLAENPRYYINDSGTGNTLAVDNARVLQLVMDSLRFWYTEMQIDGFRFDLASILGRETHGFDRGCGFFDALRQDPELANATLIAEPWDIGPGGYQLGQYPTGWGEWNDRFRDTLRRFWVAREPQLQALADCLLGTGSLFDTRRRSPQASVNFVTAHDGFTLADLVTYETRRNEANGEDNRDGHAHELAWNHGVEGETDDPDVLASRLRTRRNLLATLMASQGTPMMVAGDEWGRTQQGNNNAYCQDNELTWLDWSVAMKGATKTDAASADLSEGTFLQYVQRVSALRQSLALLRQSSWQHGQRQSRHFGLPEASWLREDGLVMQDSDWHAPGARIVGLQLLGETGEGEEQGALILVNGSESDWILSLDTPDVAAAEWVTVLDTSRSDGAPNKSRSLRTGSLKIEANSVLIARCYT